MGGTPSGPWRQRAAVPPDLLPALDRRSVDRLFRILSPVLWTWPIGSFVLMLVGSVSRGGWVASVGMMAFLAFVAYWPVAGVLWIVAIMLDKPAHCWKGHTNLGYYYGAWRCRTCSSNDKRRKSRQRSKLGRRYR
jgi:hypothetical protein